MYIIKFENYLLKSKEFEARKSNKIRKKINQTLIQLS